MLVLEIFTSLALNMSNGVIVSAMSDAAVAMDEAAEAAVASERRGGSGSSKRGAAAVVAGNACDGADTEAAGGSGGRPASGSLDAYLMPADAVSRMSYQTVDFSDSEDGAPMDRQQHIMHQLQLGLAAGRASPQVGASAGDLSGEFGVDGLAHDAAVPRGDAAVDPGTAATAAAVLLQPIALPLPTWFRRACSVFCMYTFIGAVLYDAYTALERVAPPHSAMFWTIGLGLLFWRYTVYAAFHARMRALLGLPARGFRYDASMASSSSAASTEPAPASLGGLAAAVTKQSPKTLLQWLVKDPWQCAVASFAICISAGAATLLREADAGLIGLVVPMLVLNEVVCPLVRVVADSSHHFFSLATCLRAGLLMGGVIASAVNGGDAAIALFSISFVFFLALSCLRVAPLLCRCCNRQ